jgi:ribosomal protein S18 acetylase RimI-like enzyme
MVTLCNEDPSALPITSLRPSRPTDGQSVAAVLYSTFESTWLPQITATSATRFRNSAKPELYWQERGALFVVAEIDGHVVGFVDWDADFVNALHVRNDYARRGIGRLLLNHAEGAMIGAGQQQARLETDTFNIASRAFYFAHGYQEREQYPDLEWDSNLTTILMVKALCS